jgi:hypothetical protein
LKIAQTPQEVIIRDADAKDIRIPAHEIDEVVPSKQSLMPDNVVSQLKFDQFIDLVAFLRDRAAQESLQGIVSEFSVIGPFNGGLDTVHALEPMPDVAAKYTGANGNPITWQPRLSEPNGRLALSSALSGPKSSAYFVTFVKSPHEQKVRLLAGSDDSFKIWVNGKHVLTGTTLREAAPDQESAEIALRRGWNTILGKVSGTGNEHAVYLRFAGGKDLTFRSMPDEK